jgi:hypothetical protein
VTPAKPFKAGFGPNAGLQIGPVGLRGAGAEASYSTVGIGHQLSFRLIQDDQFVAKGVAYSRTTANRYVEWGQNRLAPGLQKGCESLVDVCDQYVRLRSDMKVYYQLGVRLRKTETRSLTAAPQQSVT